jgi:uncharacterized protein (DUF433 family)
VTWRLGTPRILLAHDVLAGNPIIRGTRLSVEFVIGLMADEWYEADILGNYPDIAREVPRLRARYAELIRAFDRQ